MRGERHIIALAIAGLASCSKPTSRPERGGSFDRNALLAALGECALGTYRTFDDAAKQLASASSADAQREAWRAASAAWQEAELMQFGPLGPTTSPGGQGLRDNFYSTPLIDRCAVDRAIVSRAYESPSFASTSLVTARGLAPLEYLLFHRGDGNACPATDEINTTGAWTSLSAEDRELRRARYAKVLADDLRARSAALVALWEPGGGAFLSALADAGRGSKFYASPAIAINAVSDALFYVDTHTKDAKLAVPIGLIAHPSCTAAPCADLVEAPYSTTSRVNVRRNLVALEKLLIGCNGAAQGVAFDDYLVAVGARAVAEDLRSDLAAAIAAVDAFPHATFEEAIAKSDTESIKAIHTAVKRVTDTLKNEFVAVLELELPTRVGGDAD